MDEILQWLTNGKDYNTGVSILERHHKNRTFVQHFRHTTAKFAAAKLEARLAELRTQYTTITEIIESRR